MPSFFQQKIQFFRKTVEVRALEQEDFSFVKKTNKLFADIYPVA